MAVYSHNRIGSRVSLTGILLGADGLPGGSCNFRDLSLGARAPICGCKRFWLNSSNFNGPDSAAERAWCFCGHHACFHNAFDQQQRAQEQGQVSSSGALGGAQMSGVRHDGATNNVFETQPTQALRRSPSPSRPATGLGIRSDSSSKSRPQSQSINARVWEALNDFARNQDDNGGSEAASKLPSTAAPSVIEENRLSPNRIMQDRLELYRPMGPPVSIPQVAAAPRPAEEYSATEVATPSIAGTPDFRALASSSSQARTSPGHLHPVKMRNRNDTDDMAREPPQAIPLPSTPPAQLPAVELENQAMSTADMQSMLQVYGRRLEILESLSFSHVPIEEIQERLELFDGRLIDLEQWRSDHAQDQAGPDSPQAQRPSSKQRRRLPNETSSFDSDGSFDLNAAAHTEAVVLATLAANAETNPRIDDLENRVAELETRAPPSFAHPWHVQVVMLPWGRDLTGIWFSAQDSTQHCLRSTTQLSEEWTGAQSATKLSFNSSFGGAWTTESIEAWANEAQEWLSPKACGPSGMVFQRLASRGFVRDVELKAPDSRHVLDTIRAAFAFSLDTEQDLEGDAKQYQGLAEYFVPVRKVRKSTRLRFLSPSEMITSATWTASFLDSSVFMKVKDDQRRLYITTPGAYIQSTGKDWSWKKIRELPIYDARGGEQAAQASHVAIEACWTYNDTIDRAASIHSSFASHGSRWSSRNQLEEPTDQPNDRQLVSPRSEGLLLHRRTASLPSSQSAEQVRESLPKRRVASFETGASVPKRVEDYGTEVVAKRRRISTSPEVERRGVNFTPRLSREPPSPFTSELAMEARSQGTSSRKRGNTPFAYATPHSNINIVVRLDSIVGDGGDTEADTDMGAAHSEHREEEWHGVDDETNLEEQHSGDESSEEEEDESDDDDENDSLTIYLH